MKRSISTVFEVATARESSATVQSWPGREQCQRRVNYWIAQGGKPSGQVTMRAVAEEDPQHLGEQQLGKPLLEGH